MCCCRDLKLSCREYSPQQRQSCCLMQIFKWLSFAISRIFFSYRDNEIPLVCWPLSHWPIPWQLVGLLCLRKSSNSWKVKTSVNAAAGRTNTWNMSCAIPSIQLVFKYFCLLIGSLTCAYNFSNDSCLSFILLAWRFQLSGMQKKMQLTKKVAQMPVGNASSDWHHWNRTS